MVTRAAVVAEARSWIGTRWHHQADMKGVGCDCAGLVRGVSISLGTFPADYINLPAVEPFLGYARTPNGDSMVVGCEAFMERISPAYMRAGDAVLMRWGSDPHHMGILGDYPLGGLSLIHAYARMRKVVEHRLDDAWAARVVAVFVLPGVTG